MAEWNAIRKNRIIGNIRFIGELFKLNMIGKGIIHSCIKRLLTSENGVIPEEFLEQLCKLLTNIGHLLDQEEAKNWIDDYFNRLKVVSKKVCNRIRFMIEDLIKLREKKWRVENNKTVEPIKNEPVIKKITIMKKILLW